MMDAVTFTVPGDPVPFAWRQRGASRYVPPRQKSAMHTMGLCARRAMAGRPLLEGALEIDVVFTRRRPAARRNQNGPWPDTSAPDLTNLVKLAEDALKGIVFEDDAVIARQRTAKWATDDPADAPKTIITIRRLAP